MKRKKLKETVVFFALLMVTAAVWAAPIPDTGQKKCYDVDGNVIICPSPSQALYGQDANYTINPMSYTKLDSSGNDLPDSASSWVTVRDNVTGMIWEMKTNKNGKANFSDPHDADNMYTWYDSNPATNGGNVGSYNNGLNTEAFINALNDDHYGGFNDWRLPTIKELAYIVNYSISYPGPTIDTICFPHTQSSFYWSSTTHAYTDFVRFYNNAWGINFYYGNDLDNTKVGSNYVRAVRGPQSESSENFIDNGDGTVTDTSTDLMWQKDSISDLTWEQALAYCEGLTLGAYTDWRLPTIKELRSIVDYSQSVPAINYTYFPDTHGWYYWTSTTPANDTSAAWDVFFGDGEDNYNKCGKNNGYYMFMRAVRGGQSVVPTQPTPDIKANGQNSQITISSNTPVSITASLAPGDQNGKPADWWLAESTPWGLNTLTASGWLPGINPLVQYPLLSIPSVEIFNGILPVGDYAFYFVVDMTPNGVLDSPFYYDYVQVHVTQ